MFGKFQKGDQIRARWHGGRYWYTGTISCVNTNFGADGAITNTYNIDYDDGDKESNVIENLVQKNNGQNVDPQLLRDAQGTYVSFRVRAINDAGYGYPSELSNVYDPSELLEAADTASEEDDDEGDFTSTKEED